MNRIIIAALLVLLTLTGRAQSIVTQGQPKSMVRILGTLKTDSTLQAPTTFAKVPYFDSTGRLAVVNGIFYYHDGTSWTTPAAGSGVTLPQLNDTLTKYLRKRDSTLYATQTQYRGLVDSLALRFLKSNVVTNYNSPNNVDVATTAATNTLVSSYKLKSDSTGGTGYTTRDRTQKVADSVIGLIPSTSTFVKYTDTGAMLASYVLGNRLTDTSNNLRTLTNARVRFTDTANMLLPYVLGNRLTDTAAALRALSNARVKYSDTAAMLSTYVLGNRLSDTASALRTTINTKGSGTMTQVNTGYGIVTATITTTGTIAADTDKVSSKIYASKMRDTGITYTNAAITAERSATATLTNKRITYRVTSAANYTTSVTIDADNYDVFEDSLQAGALLFNAPSGTPTNYQLLEVAIRDNGTARALTYNAIFAASTDLSLPTTTTISKWLFMLFQYNSRTAKWYLIAKLDNL